MSTGSIKPFRSNSGLETQLWLHLSQLRAAPAPALQHLARPAIRAQLGGDTTLHGPTTRPLAWAPPPQQPQTPSHLLGSEASSLADPTPRAPPSPRSAQRRLAEEGQANGRSWGSSNTGDTPPRGPFQSNRCPQPRCQTLCLLSQRASPNSRLTGSTSESLGSWPPSSSRCSTLGWCSYYSLVELKENLGIH